MRHQTIEETFRAIRPKQRGVPAAPPISEGFTTSGSGFSDSLSQAAQEISQLRASYQAQADLIAANTTALEKNSSSAGNQSTGGSVGGAVKSVAESVLGGGILGIIPLISGIASLFGGGSSAPAPLPTYVPPPSIQLDSTIQNGFKSAAASTSSGVSQADSAGSQGLTGLLADGWSQGSGSNSTSVNQSGVASGSDLQSNYQNSGGDNSLRSNGIANQQTAFSPQVTVNISAMDSQSFLDRSADIASAVREAVLNLHPLNSVLADL